MGIYLMGKKKYKGRYVSFIIAEYKIEMALLSKKIQNSYVNYNTPVRSFN